MEKAKGKKLFYRPAGKRKGMYTPTQIICVSFVIVIALGTFLLSLPVASKHGRLDVLDAMFTATSATCVTGLIVRDTWTQFTYFGQAVILLLIQVGGLGLVTLTSFFALAMRRRMGFRDLRLLGESVSADGYAQAKVVLSFSVILWLGGAALIALMEWNNPASMGGLSVPGKLMAALFQSVSTRTAGMNTIDLAACGPITKLLMSVLQFIGAAPGSTGGGVKVTTFAVIILTIRSVAQGRDDCVIAEHHIESKTVYRALTIIVLGGLAAVGSAVVVFYNTSDAVSVIDAIFESCSAFGTVGLSVGVTAQLNRGAKILYMLVMFMGRVGPVSLAMSLTAKPDDNKRKIMPVGHINVG